MFRAMLIAGLGGFVGTCLRFLTGKIFHFAGAEAFPWGTFTAKQWLGFGLYVGLSFVLGLLLVWLGRSLIKTI